MRVLPLVGLCLITAACSSIVEGTSQELAFNSTPSGADCHLERNGETLGTVRTPGTIRVQKTKHDIEVKCLKDGYQDATVHLNSDAAAATFGNILLGGGIGWAIDSASGADNKYNDITNVTLQPLAPSPAAPPVVAPSGAPAAPPAKDAGGTPVS